MNLRKIKLKRYHWLIALLTTTFVAMYVYGMTAIYLPDPVYIGLGQYLDVGTGIAIFCLVLSGIFVGMLFKKNKK